MNSTLQKLADDPNLFHVICLKRPYKYGTNLFTISAQRVFGKDCFIHEVEWEQMLFNVVTVFRNQAEELNKIAAECNCVIKDGIPTILDSKGQRWFPMSSSRVFMLESNNFASINDLNYEMEVERVKVETFQTWI